MEKDVERAVKLLAAFPLQRGDLGQVVTGEVAGIGPEAELVKPHIGRVGSIGEGDLQLFQVAGRGEQLSHARPPSRPLPTPWRTP